MNAKETETAVRTHADTVWRTCLVYFGNSPDAQDAFQETFLRYLKHEEPFADAEHEKAWLIRVAINVCKDMLKRAFRSDAELPSDTDSAMPYASTFDEPGGIYSQIIDALLTLPRNERLSLYLTAIAGYSAKEAARMMDTTPNTLYSHVHRARKKLKEVL